MTWVYWLLGLAKTKRAGRDYDWQERAKSLFVVPENAEWFKISLAEWWHPPGNSIHHRKKHSPAYPTAGGIVEVRVGMCTLVRPSSRSWSCGFILKGLVQDLLSFFFLRMILVSRRSAGSLCTVHSAFSGSAWYVHFTLIWWIQGAIPATFTAVGVIRITV